MRQRNPLRHLGAALGFVLVGAVAGCGGSSMDGGSMPVGPTPSPGSPSGPSTTAPPAVAQAQQANTPVDPAIVTADNAFGLNLFENL